MPSFASGISFTRAVLFLLAGLLASISQASAATALVRERVARTNSASAFTNTIAARLAAFRARPNIILILSDDLGYGDLGCYGQKKIQTPHLDRLAAEGMRFTQCYAGTCVCAPSRAALMTGLHTGHTRIRGNAELPLATNETTVAEVLKRAGYDTGLIGKWGLGLEGSGATPGRRGFDEFLGYLSQTHAHDYYPTQLWRSSVMDLERGSAEFTFTPQGNEDGAKGIYSHDFFTRMATNFVRSYQNKPFFLFLSYTIPHAQNELKNKGMVVPSDEPYAAQDWPQPEKNKAAMITRLDRDVGVLLAQIKRLNLDSNTIVFFTSDNGPHKEGGVNPEFFQSSGPLRGIKRDLYEGGIRVPMIVRWPGHVPTNSVSDEPWAFWDFLPTAAALARTAAPDGLDGLSMLPTLLGQPQTNRHDFFYWEFHEKGSKQAVRLGEWKGLRLAPGSPLELYNLRADPGEANNVAAAHTNVVAQIETCLRTARTKSEQWPLQSAAEEAARRKRLAP